MTITAEAKTSAFDRLIKRFSALLGIIAASALVVLMLAMVLDVAVRWVTRASLPGMMEVAETALVTSVFLGLAWTSIQGGHVAVSIVTDRLGPKLARWVSLVVWVLNTFILGWMTYALLLRADLSTGLSETRFGLVQWPIWPIRWVIAVGIFFWAVIALVNVVRLLTGKEAYGDDSEVVLDA